MSKTDKLVARLLSLPTDFTWDELLKLLGHLGYSEQAAGKTGGSRRAFSNAASSTIIRLHNPHPGNVLKNYQLRQLIQHLQLTNL